MDPRTVNLALRMRATAARAQQHWASKWLMLGLAVELAVLCERAELTERAERTELVPFCAPTYKMATSPAAAAVNDDFVFACPHCDSLIQVPRNGINCQIFRHGAYKADPSRGVPPHAPKAECDRLVAAGLIYGCGRPFRFDGVTATACDYI